MPLEIEVEGLRKTFGRREVLKGLSFSLERGGFLSIFGPNGAGKTTTLRVLATLLTAGAGKVNVAGHDVREDPMPVRSAIGLISHTPMLYPDLTAEEKRITRARRAVDKAVLLLTGPPAAALGIGEGP